MIKKAKLLNSFLIGSAALLLATNSWSMMCSTDPDTLIPDDSANGAASDANPGSPGSITIDVPPGAVGTITDLDFQLDIDIDFPGDLIVTLTSPSGTTVTLINRPGRADDGSGAGGFGCGFGNTNIDVTLDDSAGVAAEGVCAGTPAITGTLSPTGNLSDFNGEPLSGTWTLTAVDFFPADQGTFISANNCLSVTTTPVTVSSVKTRQTGRALIFDWQTDSEAFNLGFHLWGMIDGQWQQLNKRLVAAESVDSLTPTNYRKRVRLSDLPGEVTQVGLSALSTSGQEDFYGPFDIGESYGEQSVPQLVDWAEQRAAYDQAKVASGYTRINNRWVKNTEKRQLRNERQENRYQDVVLTVNQEGVYRVTHQALLAQGTDLSGMRINKLAITRDGQATPRQVKTLDGSKRFGDGSEIIFFATGPTSHQSRYVDRASYRISLDSTKVLNVPEKGDFNQSIETLSSNHKTSISFGERNAYLFALPGDDPWYDTSVRAFGQTASHSIDINIPGTADLAQAGELALSLVGGFEFALIDADGDGEVEPNHHFKVYVNRNLFPEPVYEGFSNGLDPVEVIALIERQGQLSHGTNTVEFELIPDNGYNLDAMFYLGGSLTYQQENVFTSQSLNFVVEEQAAIEILDKEQEVTSAYSYDQNGNFSELAFIRSQSDDSVMIQSPFNPSLSDNPKVWISNESGYLQATEIFRLAEVQVDDLSLEDVDYVVIADPSLIGEDLQRFAEKQAEMGRATKVVDVQDVFNQYADGLVLPQAIADYLSDQALTSDYQYVLLVGSHTYNYRGYNSPEGQEPVTMIPSFYRAADLISEQIPTAAPFVDFDQDGFPDRAIGRWPVRDLEQLKNVVNKSLRWHAQDSHKSSQTSLFIADINESFNNFTSSSERIISSLGLPEQSWTEPLRVYSDDVAADPTVVPGQSLSATRDALVEGLNQGQALTVFSGHGAPITWGSQRLVNASVVERFDNAQTPSLMIPLACYTTYYETPEVRSLSELLLTDSENGAVALSGAALLSATLDNENFTRGLLQEMTVAGVDLGTAVLRMKQRMKGSGPGKTALVYNWVTLGDPTISFGLPDITPEPEIITPNRERLLVSP